LIRALETNDWIQTRAAKELGITMRQIGYKIKKHNLGEMVKTQRNGRDFQGMVSPSMIKPSLESE
jgi:Nif-specific regulatory protein